MNVRFSLCFVKRRRLKCQAFRLSDAALLDIVVVIPVNVVSEGRTLLVAVPAGGVVEGTRFSAIVIAEQGSPTSSAPANPHNITSGHWRDGLW